MVIARYRWTRVRLALTALSLALLLAACSDSSKPPAQTAAVSTTDTSPPVTITWSFWGDSWEVQTNERIVRTFEREHPNIKVQLEHHPWNEYFDWLRGEWQAGRSPDLMFLNYIPSYVALGELEPIDSFVARDKFDLTDFYPALLDSFRASGALYGLPRDNDTKVIYYNKTHLAEAGIPEPATGWTWQDLRNAALKLTRHDGAGPRYGFGFEPDFWWMVWLWQHGGEVLDNAFRPTDVRLDSPQGITALQFLQDLIYLDRVTPPPAQLNTDDMNKLFREGRLSMVFGNHALVPWFTETPGLSWDVAPLPRDVSRANVAGGAGFVIGKRSQHKDAAWQLMQFLTGPKGQSMLADSGVITPARRSVREDNIFLRLTSYNAGVFLTETEIGRPVPNFPGVTDMNRAINEALKPLWRGERSAAEVVHELAPKLRSILGLQGH
jgi:multiple sugar transport system substrate-binding protein